ncbi:hypothetical protein JCM3765_001268 [Sporobolomyces pararoseus]
MPRVDCTPISSSIPHVLAPDSRPSSPHSTLSLEKFTETVSILSARLSELDQTRRKLGPDHLGSWGGGLGRLECTILKGALEKSPWALTSPGEQGVDEEDLLRGIPMNMGQWEEWEQEKLARKQAEKKKEKKEQSRPQLHKRRKTEESIDLVGEKAREGKEVGKKVEEEKSKNPQIPATTKATTTLNAPMKKDRTLNNVFVTSKPSTSSPALSKKPGNPLSTPRQTQGSAKSPSFPSLDTLNSAARSPSPHESDAKSHDRRESWKSGEGGENEEVLFELGHSQAVLPTSTQNPLSSLPRSNSSKKEHFLSSPTSLPGQGATNKAFTSTPYHRRLDDLSIESNGKTFESRRRTSSPDSQNGSSKSNTVLPQPKAHSAPPEIATDSQQRGSPPRKMEVEATPLENASTSNPASPFRSPSSTPGTPSSDVSTAPPAQRVSFYVSAADDMLEAVFKHEAFLFSPAEQHALRRFQLLEYQSRYLFMRLFLRKHGWIRLDGIGYENDIKDLTSACQALWQKIEFTPSPPAVEPKREESDFKPVAGPSTPPKVKIPEPDSNVIDLTLSDDEEDFKPVSPKRKKKLGDCEFEDQNTDLSRLAEDKEVLAVEDPEVALSLLTMDELVALGKRMKVTLPAGKTTRGEWTKALLRTSNQSTLSFFPSSSYSKGKGKEIGFGVGYDSKGNKLKQSSVVARQALKSIGPVIRLSPTYVILFNRLSLVYHRTSYTATSSQPNKTSSLTASLLARFGKRRYPDYIVSRSFSIFPSRQALKQFEAAMEIEKKVEEALEGVWGPGVPKRERETAEEKRARFKAGTKIWEEVEDEWKELCREAETEMKEEEDGDEKRRLYYRRRFHPGWPLSRAAYKAAACYAKLGDHEREVEILRFLLAQTSFRRGKRGDWYDRLALVLMKYPLGEELVLVKEGESKPKKKERLLRARREEALRICETGLEDPFTHLIYKSSLQRRISRIESALDIPKDDRRTFKVLRAKSEQRVMEGERLDDPTIGKKSVWRASDGDEVSVEELALEQFHSENGVLTSIFALVFWDIIFAPVDGVFETAYQSAPLDLATDAFAIVRRPAIDARLAAIAKGEAVSFLIATDERERPLNTWAVGINWERFSREDLVEIVECIGGPALASILTVFVEEYGHRTGGIPDLWFAFLSPMSLWNPSESSVMLSEIKGPGDKLSETQKVWIDVLLSSGVGVEVCRVVESRKLDEIDEGEEDESDSDDDLGSSEKAKKGRGKGKAKRKRASSRGRSRSTSTAVKRAKTEEISLSDDDSE